MHIPLTNVTAGRSVGGFSSGVGSSGSEEGSVSKTQTSSMSSVGGSRFFVLKSVGKSVIRNSLGNGSYSVQPIVGVRLNRAFIKSRGNVFLIFSTKKSKAFQALGKMRAVASLEPNGRRFRFWVEWLTDFVHVPFSEVDSIKQRSESQFSVTASQDGQEIGGWAGRQLASLLLVAVPPRHHYSGRIDSLEGPESDPERETTPEPDPEQESEASGSDPEPESQVELEPEPEPEPEPGHLPSLNDDDGLHQAQETWDLLRPSYQLERFKEYPATVQPQLGMSAPLVWNKLQFSVDLNKMLWSSLL